MAIADELQAYNDFLLESYATAVNKGAQVPAGTPLNLENLQGAIQSIQTSTDVVNGVIEKYKAASGTVAADTFVEFVRSVGVAGEEKAVASSILVASIDAALIDTDKVFVIYGKSSALYGVVCTVSNTTISAGTPLKLTTSPTNAYLNSRVVKISNDKVFIIHHGSNSYLYGMVCTVSGTTITQGTDTQLNTEYQMSTESGNAIQLEADKVIVLYRGSSSTVMTRGEVCTVSGRTITCGTVTSASVFSYGDVAPLAAVLVDDNKIFMAGGYYGRVMTVSGYTMTAGGAWIISPQLPIYSSVAVKLETNKVLVVRKTQNGSETDPSKQDGLIYGVVCEISDNKIKPGLNTMLLGASGNGFLNALALNSSQVLFVFTAESAGVTMGSICTITDSTILPSVAMQLSDKLVQGATGGALRPYFLILLEEGKVMLGLNGKTSESNTKSVYATVFTGAGAVNIQASASRIEGITKTKCTTSAAGDVWVLDTSS